MFIKYPQIKHYFNFITAIVSINKSFFAFGHEHTSCRLSTTSRVVDRGPRMFGSESHFCICTAAIMPPMNCSQPITEQGRDTKAGLFLADMDLLRWLSLYQELLNSLTKIVTVQHGVHLLVILIHDLKICGEGNRFLLTGFQFWGCWRALLLWAPPTDPELLLLPKRL